MGLSQSDVATLTETLAAGKHPRVVFTEAAGQVAGKTGKVARLDEPHEGDFVVVRFGHDELPFSPGEVRLPHRGEFSRKKAAPAPGPAGAEGPSGPPLLTEGNNGDKSDKVRSKESVSVNDQPGVPVQATAPREAPAPPPRKRAASKKAGPELSVTLLWRDGEWSVQASKGAKVIAKPVPVKPTTAVEMVRSLDSPAVAAVVEDIVDQQRQQAADEAERLRQELAAVEARLAELE